jgi:hypothetical protein
MDLAGGGTLVSVATFVAEDGGTVVPVTLTTLRAI